MSTGPLEIYHGIALARLCRWSKEQPVALRAHASARSAYVVDERIALYVKYSTKRMTPWQFSFADVHQREISDLRGELDEVFVILVCGFDGVACLSGAQYGRLLDDEFRPMEWIKAVRKSREKYTLTGSDSLASFKVADSDYPARIYRSLDELDRKEVRGRHTA